MVNGASASVVTADPEHCEGKNTACNKSCVAREVVQAPHCFGSNAGACLYWGWSELLI